jgi:hypothetical protein
MRLRRFTAALVCAAASVLAGCFQSSTLVKLNPDGSGTIEQTTTMTAQALAQLQELAAMGDKDKSKTKMSEPFSLDEAKAAAAKMGTGVSLVSADKIDTPDRKGIKAVYAFKDIRTLSLNEMNTPGGADMGAKTEKPMTLTFSQLPNGHALLTIKNDTDVTKNMTAGMGNAGQSPLGGMDSAQAAEMMKTMLGGMKVDFAIQVGHVVKTNVPYVSGGTVTLLSMDFDQVLSNPAALEQMQKPKSMADTKAALQGVKGIKVSLDPELTIEFTK